MNFGECDDCLGGILFPAGECPTCGPCATSPPSKTAVDEFRRKIASTEWQRLVAEARRHLDLHPELHGTGTWVGLEDFWGLPDSLCHRDTDVVSGADSTFVYNPLLTKPLLRCIEVSRVAAILASYLGTSSRWMVTVFLVSNLPLRPEALVPASLGKAIDDWKHAFYELLGDSFEPAPLRKTRNRWLGSFVDSLRLSYKDGISDWDTIRILWNREFPNWAYDSTEAFRKAAERWLKHRPTSEN